MNIQVIGKNCNINIDGKLTTIVLTPEFNLTKLYEYGMKYYQFMQEYDSYSNLDVDKIKKDKAWTQAEAYKKRILLLIEPFLKDKAKAKEKEVVQTIRTEKKLVENKVKILEKSTVNIYEKFRIYPEFSVKGTRVCLKGIDIALPDAFLTAYIKERELQKPTAPLINFMYNLMLNPNEQVRNSIFSWIHDRNFRITPNGYIYAVRWVKPTNQLDNSIKRELVDFVSNEYSTKRFQKKAPKNYVVYYDNDVKPIEYKVTKKENISKTWFQDKNNIIEGNLEEMYADAKEVPDIIYTDNYSSKFIIKLGEVVEMPRDKTDETIGECRPGLHACSINDAYTLPHNFGNQLIGILVSPADIVSMPRDSYKKFRCCRYYVKSLLSQSTWEELKKSDLVVDDDEFEKINLQDVLMKIEGKDIKFSNSKNQLEELRSRIKALKLNNPIVTNSKEAINHFSNIINRIIKV